MIYGVGTDILHKNTISESALRVNDSFYRKTYTEAEQEEGEARENRIDYYRLRFAGKEAVFKALRLHPDSLRQWREIEILCGEGGVPEVHLHEELRKIMEGQEITRIDLSLSHDGDYYQAFCVISAQGE